MRSRLLVPCLALSFLIVPFLGGKVAHAQLAHLVDDLNTTDAHPIGFAQIPTPVSVGTTLFFTGDDGGSGNELWKVDTTTGIATLVKDICPGPCSSTPNWLTPFGNLVFFEANDGVHGSELWRSDGTEAGTFLLGDLSPGISSGVSCQCLDALGGKLLFSVQDPLLGGLWSTDGTRAGTQRIVQISGSLLFLASSGTRLLATRGGAGGEMWISDGTAAGTYQIHGLSLGPGSLSERQAAALPDGSFVFAADDGTHGVEPWRTDGTDAGTVLVQDIRAGSTGSYPDGFVPLNGKLYFAANATSGWNLWATDGTPAGTAPVGDTFGSTVVTPVLERAGNRLYFTAGSNSQLMTSDGTAAGTRSLNLSNVLAIGSLGNSVMVLTEVGFSQLELWKTDGTQAGTIRVQALGPTDCGYVSPPSQEVNGELYFYQCLSDGSTGGPLWKTDGTQAGTVQVQAPVRASTFSAMYSASHTDSILIPLGGGLFFDGGPFGVQIWHTDSSAAGTQTISLPANSFSHFSTFNLGNFLVAIHGGTWRLDQDGSVTDLGASGAAEYPLQRAGNQIFFLIQEPDPNGYSYDIWKTDGTAAGTSVVTGTNFFSANYPDYPDFKGTAGSVLLYESDTIRELRRSDGTGPGTFLLQSSRPVAGPTASVGNELFFPSWGAGGAWMLWKTDGTVAGTVPVRTFPEAPLDSRGPDKLTPAGSQLFFTLTDPVHGEELWVSDGTDAGTHLAKDVLPGAGSSGISFHATLGSRVLFTANDGVHGVELWVSDGTDAGTFMLQDIAPGAQSSGISPYSASAGGRLFFTADDGTHGIELWTSDGTAAGTHLVKDILPGVDSSLPVNLTAVGRHVVFTATDGVHGSEPWVSDGTDAGTFLLQDIAPGSASSGPLSYTIGSSKAFFVADDGTTGAELWTVPRLALDPSFTDVPSTFWAWRFIESLAASGVSSGCGDGDFCPGAYVNRAQMAIFVLTARGTPPPPATGTRFDDVPPGYWAGPWIEELAHEGVVSGCSTNPPLYCPDNLLTRAEMAVLLVLARHETPPPATGISFADVPANYWAARFIEKLAADGITSGCGGGNYCPDQPITRGEMAVFLATAFHLPLP